MRKLFIGIVLSCASLIFSSNAMAEENSTNYDTKTSSSDSKATYVQLSLFDPVQIFDNEYTVNGLRINFIYGYNYELNGLDLGLVNRIEKDCNGVQISAFYNGVGRNFKGFQTSIVNYVEGNAIGLQCGFANVVSTDYLGYRTGVTKVALNKFTGLQVAAFNGVKILKGAQIAAVNVADTVHGVQIGLVNYSKSLKGVQIGFLNFQTDRETFKVLPILNVGW